MGKFDGILMATDLDGTILTDDKKISADDKASIEYFMSEGGYFTICSGRSIKGVAWVAEQLKPNAPIITFNGAVICDQNTKEILWESFLDTDSAMVVELIDKNCPFSGIEIWAEHECIVSRSNFRVREQLGWENIVPTELHYSQAPLPWRKVLFIQEADEVDAVKKVITGSPYYSKYNFMQSAAHYYEMLPKNASKGLALLKVAEILGLSSSKTVGVGDNDNDLSLVELSGIGVAVSNASPALLKAADYVTRVTNNSSPISEIIKNIETEKLTF